MFNNLVIKALIQVVENWIQFIPIRVDSYPFLLLAKKSMLAERAFHVQYVLLNIKKRLQIQWKESKNNHEYSLEHVVIRQRHWLRQ